MDNYLMHYGRSKIDGATIGSGRYPLGSGDNPYQHDSNFYSMVKELKGEGLKETEIATQLGMSTTQLRARYSLAKDAFKAAQVSRTLYLHDKGYSNTKIGEMMGLPESTVRNYLDPTLKSRINKTAEIADILAKEVDKKKYLDIGAGVEYQLGVSKTKLNTAVAMLEDSGYKKHFFAVEQATNPGKKTSVLVLAKDDGRPNGEQWKDIWKNRDKIQSVLDVYSDDGGRSVRGIEKPTSIDSKRIRVRYKEDGGEAKDGLIELRPGVSDLYMGNNQYSQVRIAVDGTHYLKGMAVFNDNLPRGVDIVFNTNKSKGTPMLGEKDNSVLKTMKNDKDNPFESTIRQIHYTDKDGKEKLSAINLVNTDEDWGSWAKTLSSQMLSKQRQPLVKQQLDLTYKNKEAEFKDNLAITNPVVKQRVLMSFADDCDAAAVHLKAAALPRQATHVILPVNSLKADEIYATNYKNGESVILIRHPHAGTFEIPVLKVNNRNQEGRKLIGTGLESKTAVGINHIVAQQLSGADFDGDTVLVIPTRNQNIKASRPIKELVDFNPSERYKAYPGMPEVSQANGFHKQREMGKVSNLITDMTIKGATQDEIVRAVKHSMVVIDAEKHNLNWRLSEQDNGIKELKAKYQGGRNKGASTIISRAKSEARVDQRKNKAGIVDAYDIDPRTGEKVWTYTGESYTNKAGKTVKRTTVSTKMYETDDAFSLVSDARMPVETTYATYANKMKALANDARKEAMAVKPTPYSPSAKQTYQAEVDSLNAALNIAKRHAPQERRAQLVTNKIVETKIKDNPDLKEDKDALKKVRAQVLEEQRIRTGGKKSRITISEKEWQAIQSGAISNSKLKDILDNADLNEVKKLATPRTTKGLSKVQVSRAKALVSAGYTLAEVADQLGVSTSTISKAIA